MTDPSPVLIVIDMQNGFIRQESAHVVPVVADLVARWQKAGGDVVFTQYLNYPGSPFERMIGWTKLQESPEIDIAPELQEFAARATAAFPKKTYTFFNEDGVALARRHGWTDIYVCGIATESCVLKTVVDAFELDLTPWLIADASATHAGTQAHEAGLLVARRFIGRGQIITTDQIPEALLASPVSGQD